MPTTEAEKDMRLYVARPPVNAKSLPVAVNGLTTNFRWKLGITPLK